MDAKVEAFYREIFADLRMDSDESEELVDYFSTLNPPPDKLAWLRSSAFRVGSEFVVSDHDSEQSSTPNRNVAVLTTISAIVHCLEQTCMVPRASTTAAYDPETAESMIRAVYSDRTVDAEETHELFEYFRDNSPPVSQLGFLRGTAFTVATEYLADNDREQNVQLLRCINFVINAFERSCLLPKPYELKLAPSFDLDVSLSEAAQELWNLDVNRLTPNIDYTISVQGGKKPYWKEDSAADPLFTFVDKDALNRPTYKAFVKLLDNYEANTGTAEHVSSSERTENLEFLNAVLETAPMQFCHRYLHHRNPSKIPKDVQGFQELLYDIWFGLYRRERGGPRDSSGFEHVFVGEVKNGAISGFHNWIRFYKEEANGALDYRGYIKPKRNRRSGDDDDGAARTDSNDAVLTLQFAWRGVEKSVGTSFVGVSPEFELALYSMCFLLGEENNAVTLTTHGTDEFVLNIKCYTYDRDKIGTAYPEATAHYD